MFAYLKWMRASKLEYMSVSISGEPITHTCLPKSTSIELSTWELELFTKLAISPLCLDGSYVKQLQQAFNQNHDLHEAFFILEFELRAPNSKKNQEFDVLISQAFQT